MPAQAKFTLLEFGIHKLADFLLLAQYINGYRYEEDPKEQKDGDNERRGMGWDPIISTRFNIWKTNVSKKVTPPTDDKKPDPKDDKKPNPTDAKIAPKLVDKYDIFVSDSRRISWPKVAAYILAFKLDEAADFIQDNTADVLEALTELSQFLDYFRIPIVKINTSNNHLCNILMAMHSERGSTWANQLKWFLKDEYFEEKSQYELRRSFKRTHIQRSFANRWGNCM